MTELRDARLKKALEHAPDAQDPAAAPADAVRAAIHAHAAAQLRPALKAELPQAGPAPPRASFWRWLLLGGSEPGTRGRPWNAALATVLLAGFVTLVLRYEQDEAPQGMRSSRPQDNTAAPAASPPPPAAALPPAPVGSGAPAELVQGLRKQQAAADAAVPGPVAQRESARGPDPQAAAKPGKSPPAPPPAQTAPAPVGAMVQAPHPALSSALQPAPQTAPSPAPPSASRTDAPAPVQQEPAPKALALRSPEPFAAPVAPAPAAPTPGVAPVADPRREAEAESLAPRAQGLPAAGAATGSLKGARVTGGASDAPAHMPSALQDRRPPMLALPADWQTLVVKRAGQSWTFTRGQASAVDELLAGLRLQPPTQPGGGQVDYQLLLQRDGQVLATLSLAGDVLHGRLLAPDGLRAAQAADAVQTARLRALLQALTDATPR